jgi:hypothetical protein
VQNLVFGALAEMSMNPRFKRSDLEGRGRVRMVLIGTFTHREERAYGLRVERIRA